jgi:hypothetical protein
MPLIAVFDAKGDLYQRPELGSGDVRDGSMLSKKLENRAE